MRWKKLGQIYSPGNIHPKLVSHASNPLPVFLEKDVYRVFFSGRDIENRSSVGFVDVDIIKRRVIYVHDKPVFENGPENSFYSHGVSIGNSYEADGNRYILFMGWQNSVGEHWRGEIGRLILGTDYSLSLEEGGPFLSLDSVDPLSLSYPWVDCGKDGIYRMWYGSTITWDSGNGEMLHVFNQATSSNGHKWQRCGLAVPFILGTAQAFSRPTIIGSLAEDFHMWFSYRGNANKYRIGYASSHDGNAWSLRLEDAGIDVSASGWDSEMIEYPFVFDHKGQRYMLYNGNGYGRTGFGLAVLD